MKRPLIVQLKLINLSLFGMMNFARFSLLLLAFIVGNLGLKAQVLLHSEGFETDGEGSRYTSNTYTVCAGEQDFFIRTNTNPVTPPGCLQLFSTTLLGLQGASFWASEDIRRSNPITNALPPGEITTQSFSIVGHTSLEVSLYLATSANNGVRW